MGRPISLQGGSISNLLDINTIERIAISTWERFWNKFLLFGNFSAGLIGIYLGIRIIKLILDTIVHGYALHTVYGWSLYLLGAIWDSLTNLLLHLRARHQVKKLKPTAPAPETQNSGAPRLERRDNENDTQPTHTYPPLPAKENSTYTLELKESKI
ncbi:hypothetical protein RF55_13410 [Lasius niger]|uniref:Uncharacterized protein n=1 Tax=Lasius niger TaxID=67767 RepID=A0A0J7KAR9_LASNI|nr:hypothetical protein RF55_13410 [Lasius niger]